MNRVYKHIWSKRLGRMIVTSEHAKGAQGKKGGTKRGRKLTPLLLSASLLATPVFAGDLPSGGQIVAGQGTISTAGNSMTINQSSDRLIANWQDFSIGAGNSVTFQQPGTSSIALNRVTGQNPSDILGSLNANGQVFLLNPNGVAIGKSASVQTGAFVASTLGLSDEDFLDGNYHFSGNGGDILNQGRIEGAVVALIAPVVINEGDIHGHSSSASAGAALAGGTDVLLDFNGDGLLSVQVNASTVATLIDNKGLIQADGGVAILSAKGASEALKGIVNNSGMVQARTIANKDGRILLLGDMQNGAANIAGVLDASAPNGGDGGFIETSAAHVTIANGTEITTQAETGSTGLWLIDPTDFTVSAGPATQTDSGVGADTLSSNLASTSVTLQTAAAGTEDGNINVDAAVSWSAATTLTLNAHGDIFINAPITASDAAGKLVLEYGQGAAAAGNAAGYYVNAPVNLQAGQNFSTLLGSDGSVINHTVITDLGVAGSTTGTDLQGINGNLSGNYVLGADIDAAPTDSWNDDGSGNYQGFWPIGDNSTGDNSTRFTGSLDGLGHVISDLTINDPAQDDVGLFGYIDGAAISNVGLLGSRVTGRDQVGGLVGRSLNSTVTQTHASSTVSEPHYVSGRYNVGGLVGSNSNGTITQSYISGALRGSDPAYITVLGVDYVGGLVGYNGNSTVTQSYITGAEGFDVIGGNDYVGGLVGLNLYSTVTQSYASVAVSGRIDVGGLVGINEVSTVTQSYASGSVVGAADVGGLVGNNYNISTVTQSYASGEVFGNSKLGGLVGINDASTVTQSYASGAVNGDFSNLESDLVGGLVGYNRSGTVSQSYASGAVGGRDYVGGLVGYNDGGTVTQSYASGAVDGYDYLSGSDYLGGLVGANYDGSTVTQSYASGTVRGSDYIDGPESDYVGGLVGHNASNATIQTGFYATTDTSGASINPTGVGQDDNITTPAEATGQTLAELQQLATFASWGADISAGGGEAAVWRIYDGHTTPLLRGFLTALEVSVDDTILTYNGQSQTGSAGYSVDAGYDATLLLGVDDATVTGGGRNAGTYALTLAGLYSNQQGYDLIVSDGQLTVEKADLVISASDVGKTYDGTTNAAGTAAAAGATQLFGDDSLSGGTFTFDNKHAGSGKTVIVSGVTVNDGNSGNNYNVSYAANTNSTIDKAALTLAAVSDTRVYNGTANSSGTVTVTGLVSGDTLSGLSQSFDSKHVQGTNGSLLSVDVGYGIDDGNGGNNYAVATETATGTITPAKIAAITGITAEDKDYDGSMVATLDSSGANFSGLIAGDSLSVASADGAFADPEVGEDKVVDISGLRLGGADAGNYLLSNTTASTTASIRTLDNGNTPPPSGGGDTPPPSGGGDTPPPSGGGDTPPPSGGGDSPPPPAGDDTSHDAPLTPQQTSNSSSNGHCTNPGTTQAQLGRDAGLLGTGEGEEEEVSVAPMGTLGSSALGADGC